MNNKAVIFPNWTKMCLGKDLNQEPLAEPLANESPKNSKASAFKKMTFWHRLLAAFENF